jgi:hypothetical protein
MKRALFLSVMLGMFLCSTNVFAIALASDDYYDTASIFTTSYPDLITTVTSWTLSNPKRYFDAATLSLTASVTPTSSLTFTGNALATLNAYLKNNPALLNFSLTTYDALPTLSSASLQGILGKSVAPESISMALLAAGLVGLPFARRLIKAMIKDA